MKDLSILDNIKIAHRGLCCSEYPENSLGAFRKCIKRGIPIELDVHILKDNTLVVFHDDDTERMTGNKIILKDAKYDDIKNLRLCNTDEKIPLLSEVLELVNGKVLLDIELKCDVNDFRICMELCKYLDNYNGKFIVKSFNYLYVCWFRLFRGSYLRGILFSKFRNLFYSRLKLFFTCPDFVALNYRILPNKYVDRLFVNGKKILLYTIKNNKDIGYKYSGIIYES